MQTDLDQSQILVRGRKWKRLQRLGSAESIPWTQTLGTTNPPNLKLSWRRKESTTYKGSAESQKKRALINHCCSQIANNTDVQPNIFQNPVLIFLNEQFKAHENILFIVTKKKTTQQGFFVCEFIRKEIHKFNNTKIFCLCRFATTNTV